MAKYIGYEFVNAEPLRISDDNVSEAGETAALKYITGSSVRGYVINQLVTRFPEEFERLKKNLFSDDVQFLNAYPSAKGRLMIPSPKGFYEDKKIESGVKAIQNVVKDGEFDEGMKRAGLGTVSYIDDNTIYFGNVKSKSDLKIKISEKQVFRNEYIIEGYRFAGFIRVADDNDSDEIIRLIKEVLEDGMVLGNSRGSGLGKCSMLKELEVSEKLPYTDYIVDYGLANECYLYLLSDMCMRDSNGEYSGIDTEKLMELFGVKNLKIKYAATSKRQISGYNRNWGGKIPTIPVYEKGSVFHLSFDGEIDADTMNSLMDSGLGCRKNEGYGRILFLKDYDKLSYKQKVDDDILMADRAKCSVDDQVTLRIVAKNYLRNRILSAIDDFIVDDKYRLNNDKKTSKSQMGIVDSICSQFMYQPEAAKDAINAFFKHDAEKEERQKIFKQFRSNMSLREQITYLLDNDLFTQLGFGENFIDGKIMGIAVRELINDVEIEQMKLKLIISMIRFSNKKEVN